MKPLASLILGAVLLAGCSREPREQGARVPSAAPTPNAAVQSSDRSVAKPQSASAMELAHVSKPVAESPAEQPSPATPAPKQTPSLTTFLAVPPAGVLDPESKAGKVVAQAQELFKQGQTKEALDLLSEAAKDPDCENGRAIVVGKLVSLLLVSGRVEDAEAVCIQHATGENSAFFTGCSVTRYLIEEKDDAVAAVAWTERVAALPLEGFAADLNSADHLTALSAAGRLDEVIQSIPEIVTQANDAQNAKIFGMVAERMIGNSDFDSAEHLLGAIDKAASDKQAYSSMVSTLRNRIERARAK